VRNVLKSLGLIICATSIDLLSWWAGSLKHARPPFPEFKARFSAMAGWHFSRDLTRCLLIGGCGQSHVSAKHGWN